MFKPGDIICGTNDKYSITNRNMTMAYVFYSNELSMNIFYIMKNGKYLNFDRFVVNNSEEYFSYKKDFNEKEKLVLMAIKKFDLFCIDTSRGFNVNLFRIVAGMIKESCIIDDCFVKLVNQEDTVENIILRCKKPLKDAYGQISIYRR